MTPLRNGGDYYKKMLELQERLRRSEEERIRLEERFSLLEHESRSRHETCINRLRMRYIEFLEEQQARDERNHRLLGALDRVDSSLALMSAKTDRLGALRKQYETSMLSSYNNRTNGSLTGDSGVASQRDEKQRRSSNLPSDNKNKFTLSNRGSLAFGRDKTASGPSNSFGQVRSDPRYSANWSGIRHEGSQPVHSPIGSARYHSAASLMNKTATPSPCINSINPRGSLNARSSIDRDTAPQSSPAYDYRFNSSRYTPAEYSARKPESTSYSTDWRDPPVRNAARDLANSGAYDSFIAPSRSFDNASGYSRDSLRSDRQLVPKLPRAEAATRLHGDGNYSGSLKDQLLLASNQSPYTKVTEILRQELGDEDEYAGSVVENELERYISKIRNLHREADPQSVEELDHEQNTSGDLLNVTLSDDGLDFSAEEKPRPRALPHHLGNVLALAKDLADRTATSANNVAANVYRREAVDESRRAGRTGAAADDGLPLVDPLTQRADKDSTAASEAPYQFTSVDPALVATGVHDDEGRDASNKKFPLLAKNGISSEVAKVGTELAARQRRCIEDVSKSVRNNRDAGEGAMESSRIDENDRDVERLELFEDERIQDVRDDGDKLLTEDNASSRELDEAYRVVNGEESETGDNLRDIVEELEPWNLSALERRVQEIILNDEAQADYILGERDRVDASASEQAILDVKEKSYMDKINTEDCIAEDERGELNELRKDETSAIVEAVESSLDLREENESSGKVKQYDDASPAIAAQSINRLTSEQAEASMGQDNVRETPDRTGVADNLVDPSVGQGAKETEKNYTAHEEETYARGEYPQDSNAQYEYGENERYQEDPSEQYQNYDPNNVQYEQDPSGQYPYGDQEYQPVYTEDPNAQQAYAQDPDAQQAYAQDPNAQQTYAQDPNAQQTYEQDPNAQQVYEQQNPNAQQTYEQDPNAQQTYEQDPNAQQVYEQQNPNAQQTYEQDPNAQLTYEQDPNAQQVYEQQNPNAQQAYEQDPNAQQVYEQDPNAQQVYEQDPNAQQVYEQDPNAQQVYEQDPHAHQTYEQDPNAQQTYEQDQNAQQVYEQDPNAQQVYAQDPNESYLADTDQRYIADTDQEYADDANQQYVTDANYEQYVADPNQDYSTGVDQQQYRQEEAYLQEEVGAYPASTAGYVYPEGQEYASTEVYEPNAQLEPDDGRGYAEGQDASGVYESQSNFGGEPITGSGEEPINEEPEESAANHDETIIPQKEEKNSAKKSKDVIKSLLDSDTSSTIEINVSNTESDFDFN